MNPLIGGALVKGIGGLFGGLFGRNSEEEAIARQNAYNHPSKIRERAEEAGFNPLLFIGPGVGQQNVTGGTNYMGAALADAALAVGDQMDKASELARLEKLTQENKELAQKVQNMTIRPKVPGIYAQQEAFKSNREALGHVSATASSGAGVVSSHSPLAGAVVGPDDGNLTGPQLAVKKDTAAFRAFGHDFYGSGLFSTGQQMEDAVGEGPTSWLWGPVVIGDAVLNESFEAGGNLKSRVYRSKAERLGGFSSGGVNYAPMPQPSPVYSGRGNFGLPWGRPPSLGF